MVTRFDRKEVRVDSLPVNFEPVKYQSSAIRRMEHYKAMTFLTRTSSMNTCEVEDVFPHKTCERNHGQKLFACSLLSTKASNEPEEETPKRLPHPTK